ncbi:MAG: hypothetical protein PWQ62_242 [Candidatus Methanomethylophilaceae archaeon]|nr:hypothetical protein [Candidatus Methanomethylophilaceae archaeon]
MLALSAVLSILDSCIIMGQDQNLKGGGLPKALTAADLRKMLACAAGTDKS